MQIITRNIIVSTKKNRTTDQIRHIVSLETTSQDSFGKEYIKTELFDNCYPDKLDSIIQQAKNIYVIDKVIS